MSPFKELTSGSFLHDMSEHVLGLGFAAAHSGISLLMPHGLGFEVLRFRVQGLGLKV